MSDAPEFSRPVQADTLSSAGRSITVEASEEERAALAARFDLVAIDRLTAEAMLMRSADTIMATGSLSAEVVQSCVATGAPVPAQVAENFRIQFSPTPTEAQEEEEIELSEADCDVIFYSGGSVDLGDAIAETLLLALNPYPRAPDAEAMLREAGIQSEEEEATPLGALSGLKDLFKGP